MKLIFLTHLNNWPTFAGAVSARPRTICSKGMAFGWSAERSCSFPGYTQPVATVATLQTENAQTLSIADSEVMSENCIAQEKSEISSGHFVVKRNTTLRVKEIGTNHVARFESANLRADSDCQKCKRASLQPKDGLLCTNDLLAHGSI